MIRVLQVFGKMDRGGAESIIMDLYRNIDRSNVQFDFVVHTDRECVYDKEIRSLGGKIYSVPRYNGKNHFAYVKAWEKLFQEHPEYKIIHGHIHSIAGVYFKVAKKYGLTTICHSHIAAEPVSLIGFIKRVYQRPLRRISNWLFACSNLAGRWLYGEHCTGKDNYFVLKNAIDAGKYRYNDDTRKRIRQELNIDEKFVLGHVGRFHEMKNHMYLIDIFKEYYKINPNSVLLLVGDGGLRKKVEEKIEAEGLKDAVIMTGVINNVNELLQAMDCFVFPSLFEGLPVAVIEVQAAGLTGVISDQITEEVIITDLIERMPINIEPKVWAEKIQQYCESIKDTERGDYYQVIADAGYDIKTTSAWLENFYLNECRK